MYNIEIIKQASEELKTLDDKEVVKIAGVLRRIRNWFKGIFDPDFNNRVTQLSNNAINVKRYMDSLNKNLKKVETAIENGDIGAYKEALNDIRDYSESLNKELEELSDSAKKAEPPPASSSPPAAPPSDPEPPQSSEEEDDDGDKGDPQPQVVPSKIGVEIPDSELPEKIVHRGEVLGGNNLVMNTAWHRSINVRRFFKRALMRYIKIDAAEAESIMEAPGFWDSVRDAVGAGRVINVRYRDGLDPMEGLNGDYIYVVNSAPFEIPTKPYFKMQVYMTVADQTYNKKIPQNVKVMVFPDERADAAGAVRIRPIHGGPTRRNRINPLGESTLPPKLEEDDYSYDIEDPFPDQSEMYDYPDLDFAFASNNKEIKKQAGEVRQSYTRVSEVDFAKMLMRAYNKIIGPIPNIQVIGLLWAQAILESGRSGGNINLRNNNVGGITAGNYDKKWNDGWLANDRPYVTAKTGLKFKAFDTPQEGVDEYLRTLIHIYPDSIKWKATGSAMDDAEYLKSINYFGDEPAERYGGPMGKLYEEFMKEVYPQIKSELTAKGVRISEVPKPPPGEAGAAMVASKEKEPTYSPVKQESAPQESAPQEPTPQESRTDIPEEVMSEAKELIDALGLDVSLASAPLTQMVINAISDEILPKSEVAIRIKTADYTASMEYAYVLSNALSRGIDADSDVHSDGNIIDVSCKTAGSLDTVRDAVAEIDDMVAKAFQNKYKQPVVSIVRIGSVKTPLVKENKLENARRKFALKGLINVK